MNRRHTMLALLLAALLCGSSSGWAQVEQKGISAQISAAAAGGLTQPRSYRNGRFIENRGQWDQRARFLMQMPGIDLWMNDRGIVYDLYQSEDLADQGNGGSPNGTTHDLLKNPDQTERMVRRQGQVISMEFVGATNRFVAEGRGDYGTRTNYFIGNDQTKWGTDCRSFAGVDLKNIYDGIEARFYLDEELPRYDMVVAPGKNPSVIRFRLQGADGIGITSEGNLAIRTSLGQVEMEAPYAFQVDGSGRRHEVASRFDIAADGTIGFELGEYDCSRELTIDPLLYATLIAGDGADLGQDIVDDGTGKVWVVGYTGNPVSTPFPTTTGAYDVTHNAGSDVFLVNMDPSAAGAAQLVYSTFIGTNNGDVGLGIALDGNGKVWACGRAGTGSTTPWPTTAGAYNTTNNGSSDVFLVKLDPAAAGAAQLAYSTLIGGASTETANSLALDGSGNVWITGSTSTAATNFPTTTGAYDVTHNGGDDAFVTKLNPTATPASAQLVYSTFVGGGGFDNAYDIKLDGSGKPWVVGYADSNATVFPTTTGAYQSAHRGGAQDGYIMKIDPAASGAAQLAFCTLLGGSSFDVAYEMAFDGSGYPWVTGIVDP